MQIVDGEIDEAALANIGSEAARLLRSGEISTLAARFGYAVAFGREVEAAIREDLADCLDRLGSPGFSLDIEIGREFKFFSPNDIGLFALVACVVSTIDGKNVLVELIVTSKGPNRSVTLEDISVVGC